MTKQRHPEYTCSMEAGLSVITGKWKVQILHKLLNGPVRYSEIYKSITGITEKMLSQQLRELEEDKIGYTAEIDQTFRGNMEMCSAGI